MKLAHFVLCASVVLSAAGCAAQIKSATSGQIGCPADEIEIQDHETGWSSVTWTAICRGKRHYCSSVGTGRGTHQITCTPEQGGAPPAGAAPAAGGCQNDSQCKGDRVCEAGTCVDPKSK